MQFKPGNIRSNYDKTINDIGQETSGPPRFRDHIDYGVIVEVDYNSYQVQVRLYQDPDMLILGKRFWPLITQVLEIQQRFGQLRKGMHVRVHWRGRQTATFAIAEVIGDENVNLFKQLDQVNDVAHAPYKIFS